MVYIKQEILANTRSVQDKSTHKIRKEQVIWCRKVPWRLDYWSTIIGTLKTGLLIYNYWEVIYESWECVCVCEPGDGY